MKFSVIYSFDFPLSRQDRIDGVSAGSLREVDALVCPPGTLDFVERYRQMFPEHEFPVWTDEDGEEIWSCTEGDEEYALPDMLEDDELPEGSPPGRHRKYCAILTKAQFLEFIDQCGLMASSTPTAGSLGAPGFGVGWAPAIAFTTESSEHDACAYVTPLCCGADGRPIRAAGCNERDWERVRRVLIGRYG